MNKGGLKTSIRVNISDNKDLKQTQEQSNHSDVESVLGTDQSGQMGKTSNRDSDFERELYYYYYFVEEQGAGTSEAESSTPLNLEPLNESQQAVKEEEKYYYYYYEDDAEETTPASGADVSSANMPKEGMTEEAMVYYTYPEDNEATDSPVAETPIANENEEEKFYYYYYEGEEEETTPTSDTDGSSANLISSNEDGVEEEMVYTYFADNDIVDSPADDSSTLIDSNDKTSTEDATEEEKYYYYYDYEVDKEVNVPSLGPSEASASLSGNDEEVIEDEIENFSADEGTVDKPSTNAGPPVEEEAGHSDDPDGTTDKEVNAPSLGPSEAYVSSSSLSGNNQEVIEEEMENYSADEGTVDKPSIDAGLPVEEVVGHSDDPDGTTDKEPEHTFDQNGRPYQDSERSCLGFLPRDENIYKHDLGFTFASETETDDLETFLVNLSSEILDQLAGNMLPCPFARLQNDNSRKNVGIFLIRYSMAERITEASSCNPTFSPSNLCTIAKGKVTLVSDRKITNDEKNGALKTIKDHVETMDSVGNSRIFSSQYLGPEIFPSDIHSGLADKVIVAVSIPLIVSLLLLVSYYRSGSVLSRSRRRQHRFLF